MEVLDAVRTVLAVREFQDKPVPRDAVPYGPGRRIVVPDGRLSGRGGAALRQRRDRQPWQFIAVDDPRYAEVLLS